VLAVVQDTCASRYNPPGLDRGLTLDELWTIITIIGGFLTFLLHAIQAAREAARCAASVNDIRQLGTLPKWSPPSAVHQKQLLRKGCDPAGIPAGGLARGVVFHYLRV